MPSVSILGIANDILSYAHAIAVELHSYFHYFASVGRVGQCVVVAVDLVDGFLGCAVHLEFEDIDGFGHLYHKVNTASGKKFEQSIVIRFVLRSYEK